MDLTLFGYKISLEILILIGIIYLILVGHTVCGCCNYSLSEAFTTADMSGNTVKTTVTQDVSGNIHPLDASHNIISYKAKASAVQNNKEGFTGIDFESGKLSPYDLNTMPVNIADWSAPDMTNPYSQGYMSVAARSQQQPPLQNGEMDFFANVEFKPSCCPNTYSNSSGCACMSVNAYNYLKQRGGNNVPYSEI